MPSRTAHTPSVIGSSISRRCARSRSTGAVVSPSTTIPISAAASSGVAPRAMSSPARRFRPDGDQHVTMRSPIPASPANVSGRAPADSASRRISASPRATSAAFELSPEREAVGAAGRERDDVLRRRAQLDAHDVVAHVHAEEDRVHRDLERAPRARGRRSRPRPRREARERSRRRCSARRGQRPDGRGRGSRAAAPVAGIEPLREAEDRRVAREAARRRRRTHGSARRRRRARRPRPARRRSSRRRCRERSCRLRVARVPAGRVDRLGLLRVARRERHLVAVVAQEAGERRPPRARADDDDPHFGRDEVDGDGHALEPEARAQLVLDPVAVVARDEAAVVDEEPEARRARAHLRPVEEVEAASAAPGRLARLAELLQRAVELGGRDPARVAGEERPRSARGAARARARCARRRR